MNWSVVKRARHDKLVSHCEEYAMNRGARRIEIDKLPAKGNIPLQWCGGFFDKQSALSFYNKLNDWGVDATLIKYDNSTSPPGPAVRFSIPRSMLDNDNQYWYW